MYSEPIITRVNIRGNEFIIKENSAEFDGTPISRTFKIGGRRDGCIDVGIDYKNGVVISASMSSLKHFAECSLAGNLKNGEGTRMMTYALLRHVHTRMPELKHVLFDDMSDIECATDEQRLNRPRNLNKDAFIHPVPLYYFSIAFNGITWYEKHFNARMLNPDAYSTYKTTLANFLASKPEWGDIITTYSKTNGSLIIDTDTLSDIKPLFDSASTLGDFFKSIPYKTRCFHAKAWLIPYMKKHLGAVFNNYNWAIELGDLPMFGGRSNSRIKEKGKSRFKSRRNSYYCPDKIGFMSNQCDNFVLDSMNDV